MLMDTVKAVATVIGTADCGNGHPLGGEAAKAIVPGCYSNSHARVAQEQAELEET